MKRKLIVLLFLAFLAMCPVLNVKAQEGIIGGGEGNNNGGGGDATNKCSTYMNAGTYGKSGKIAVKVTVEWRTINKGKKSKKQIGKTIWVYRGNSMKSGKNRYKKDAWFSDSAVNDAAIYKELVTDKNSKKNMEKWLKRIVGDDFKKTLEKYQAKSCKIPSKNSAYCSGKNGLRLVIQNVVFTSGKCCSNRNFCAVTEYDTGYGTTYSWNKNLLNLTHSDTNITASSLSKCTKSDAFNPYSGCGYNVYDLAPVFQEEYKCKQISKTPKCKIQKFNSKTNKWTDVKTNFNCNGQTTYRDSKGKVYNLAEACEKPEQWCNEKQDEYGQCIITTKTGDYYTTTPVDCNNEAGTAGKTSYNGIPLDPNCPFKPKWNYDIDAVCEDCDSTTTGGSYHVQDVVDWEAVIHSLERTDKPTLQNYYNKGNGILCREEFNVVFPNENNVKNIRIDAGRYFTVNEKGSTYIAGVYNFEPIKVTRTRQCISTNTDATNAKTALINYSNKAALNDLGTVSLKYDEKYDKSKYKTTQTLIADQERTKKYDKQFSTTTVAGKNYQILTDKTEAYFKLENQDLYRFVSRQTGISVENRPSDTSTYVDIEKPNLPVSIKNTEGATTALYYELPRDTQLKNAVKENKANYLEQRPTVDNVYRRGIAPNETSCAKMYGINTEKYNSCVKTRSASKIADVTATNKCLMQLGPNAKFTYICDLGPGKEENCYPIATSSNSKEKKYICKDGSVCDESVYNGTEYKEGVSCQPKCTEVNNVYYGPNGEKLTGGKEEFDEKCSTPVCPPCEAGYCCEDETMVCPTKDPETGMWSCPGKGKEIIYRTIDLKNPFPGQTNYQRQTGANWCARLSNGTITCKNTNNVATTHIQNNRKNKDESVYKLKPLYEVDLNATNMKAIRDYNDSGDSDGKHTYDDFTLTCEKGTCKSTFLRDNKYSLNLKGVCNTANYNDLRICAEKK
ncbi:MAG: hypothetical protein HFH45_04620 [Bacilli bacterium]|nr:hypothetical protein [Bacilli bacterium]